MINWPLDPGNFGTENFVNMTKVHARPSDMVCNIFRQLKRTNRFWPLITLSNKFVVPSHFLCKVIALCDDRLVKFFVIKLTCLHKLLLSYKVNCSSATAALKTSVDNWPLDYQLTTVNSLNCGHLRDRELLSLIARVRNSANLYQSNVCNLFLAGS